MHISKSFDVLFFEAFGQCCKTGLRDVIAVVATDYKNKIVK
jgi:hypothetical protein